MRKQDATDGPCPGSRSMEMSRILRVEGRKQDATDGPCPGSRSMEMSRISRVDAFDRRSGSFKIPSYPTT